jgi:hypothetical protein
MRTNLAVKHNLRTHEGAPAHVATLDPTVQLRRSVLSCLLFEGTFYEDGQEIGDRIVENAKRVKPHALAALAREARGKHNLRHVPLLLLSVLADTGKGDAMVGDAVRDVVRRADELAELLAIRSKITGKPVKAALTHQLRKGLAQAYRRFSEYELAKYNRDHAIKLRDVLRIVHAKPRDAEQGALWKRLLDNELATPDTWEVQLSGGADKAATFTRLIEEGKLGYLALLRNLRNMAQAGVDSDLIKRAILSRKGGAEKVLPFRFVSAARAAPTFERELDAALLASLQDAEALPGKTAVLVDVSGSMIQGGLSGRSELTYLDAAATLASMIVGDVRIFTFSGQIVETPPRLGMAGVDAIRNSQPHGCTYLGKAVEVINRDIRHDRLIVITDEQSHDQVPDPVAEQAYLINVASNQNGVGYGRWNHIDGFSESVLKWIAESERVLDPVVKPVPGQGGSGSVVED